MSGERGRRGREKGEGRGETGSRKRRRKRRTRRESGSESNDREPGPSDEQERPGTPLAATTSHSPTPPSQTGLMTRTIYTLTNLRINMGFKECISSDTDSRLPDCIYHNGFSTCVCM